MTVNSNWPSRTGVPILAAVSPVPDVSFEVPDDESDDAAAEESAFEPPPVAATMITTSTIRAPSPVRILWRANQERLGGAAGCHCGPVGAPGGGACVPAAV